MRALLISQDAIWSNCITMTTCVFCRRAVHSIEDAHLHTHTQTDTHFLFVASFFGLSMYHQRIRLATHNVTFLQFTRGKNVSLFRLGFLAPFSFLIRSLHYHLSCANNWQWNWVVKWRFCYRHYYRWKLWQSFIFDIHGHKWRKKKLLKPLIIFNAIN